MKTTTAYCCTLFDTSNNANLYGEYNEDIN